MIKIKNIYGIKKVTLKNPVYTMKWTGFNVSEMQEFTGVEHIKKNAFFIIQTPYKITNVDVGLWVVLIGKEFSVMNDGKKEALYKEI